MAYRTYSNEEREYIVKVIDEAKENGLDLGAAYIILADRYETKPAAIKNQYAIHNRHLKADNKSPLSLVNKIKQIVKERDTFKDKAELYKDQRDDLQKKFDTMKSDYDKLTKELQQLEEILGL